MVYITIDSNETFYGDIAEVKNYPFDHIDFKFRLELSHFELLNKTYRQDLHYPETQLKFVNLHHIGMPQSYEINFKNSGIEIKDEFKKMVGKDGKDRKVIYYPV
jgi:hypothetical protein